MADGFEAATALHERLLAEVGHLRASLAGSSGEAWGAVVQGVVESHAPIRMQSYAVPGKPQMAVFCGGCAGNCHSRNGLYCDCPEDFRYPCVAVRGMAAALGVTTEVSR